MNVSSFVILTYAIKRRLDGYIERSTDTPGNKLMQIVHVCEPIKTKQ